MSQLPKVFDATEQSRSPFVVCTQYLSSLLRGCGPRLQMIYRYLGYQALDEWCASQSESLAGLQVAVFATAGWVYRRHIRPMLGYPWQLFGLGDPRSSRRTRVRIIEGFLEKPPCGYRPGWARRPRGRNPTVDVLEPPAWRQATGAAARGLKMTIPNIEWRHAWSRAHSTPGASWHAMSASYTHHEAVCLLCARPQRAAFGIGWRQRCLWRAHCRCGRSDGFGWGGRSLC